MALVSCTAVVEKVRDLTHDVREVTFRLREPAALEFQAGQYVAFKVPDPVKGKEVSRLYSINSAPCERGIVQVLYNYVGGPGTAYLHGLREGTTVNFKAPGGAFVLKTESTRDVLFVATGTGITPFRSMVFEHVAKFPQRKFTLLWGVRSERDVYYHAEFTAFAQTHPNFQLLLTLSQPGAEWQGLRGRVTHIFPDYFPSVENLEVYCCGSDAMIQDLIALCKARGECPVHREKYF